MKKMLGALLAGVGLVLSAPVAAHHSEAGEFDPNKPVTVTGVVTKIDWVHPHARVHFDVTEPSGTVTSWSVELAARVVLERMGWTGRSLKIGETITVRGDQARSGATKMNARGRELAQVRNGGTPTEFPITRADGAPVLNER